MKRITHALPFGKVQAVGLAILLGSLATGCTEVNVAIDELLGKQPPSLYAAASDQSRLPTILAKKRPAGEKPQSQEPQVQSSSEERTPSPTPSSTAPTPPEKPKEVQPQPQQPQRPAAAPPAETAPTLPEKPQESKAQERPPSLAPDQVTTRELPLHQVKGKKAPPGAMPPARNEEVQGAPTEPTTEPATFTGMPRDPFKAPTEILPSECPPSMPLCKFDRSQLKLVGVIQVSDGQFKGMVEDPDGRGYFVTPGMQIGGATVTQVTQRGITLHQRKTGQDVVLPLSLESREAREL